MKQGSGDGGAGELRAGHEDAHTEDTKDDASRSDFTVRMMDVQRLFLFGPSVEHTIELVEPQTHARNWLESPTAHYLQDFLYFYPALVNREQAVPESLREDHSMLDSRTRGKMHRGENKALATSAFLAGAHSTKKLKSRLKGAGRRLTQNTVPVAASPTKEARGRPSVEEEAAEEALEADVYQQSLRSIIMTFLSGGTRKNKKAVQMMIGNSDNAIIAIRGTYFQKAVDENDPLQMIGELLAAAGNKTLCWGRKEVVDKIPHIVKPNGRDDVDNQEKVYQWLESMRFVRVDLAIEEFKGALSGDTKRAVRMSQHGHGSLAARHMWDDYYYDPQLAHDHDNEEEERTMSMQEIEERRKDDSIVPLACKQLMWPGLGDKNVMEALTQCTRDGMFENDVMGILLDGLYEAYATKQLMSELFLYLCFIVCFTIFAMNQTPDSMEMGWEEALSAHHMEIEFLLCFVLVNFAIMFLMREWLDMWNGFEPKPHRPDSATPRTWPFYDSYKRTGVVLDDGSRGRWWILGRWWVINHRRDSGSSKNASSGSNNIVAAARSSPDSKMGRKMSGANLGYGRVAPDQKKIQRQVCYGQMWIVVVATAILGALSLSSAIGQDSLVSILTYMIATTGALSGIPIGHKTLDESSSLQPAWMGAICGAFAGWTLGFEVITLTGEFFDNSGVPHLMLPVFLVSTILFFMTNVDVELETPTVCHVSLKFSIDTKQWHEEWFEFFVEPLDTVYFKSSWNYLDLCASFMTLVSVTQWFILLTCNSNGEGVPHICDDQRRNFSSVLAISAMFLWANFLFFLRGLKETGYLMRAVMNIGKEMMPFGSVLMIVLICFSVTFRLLFSLVDVDTYYSNEGEEFPYRDFFSTFISVFCVMLGEFDLHVIKFYSSSSTIGLMVFLIYTVIVSVVLLNMLIAIISDSYAQVQMNAAANGQRERALVNLEMFDLLNESEKMKMQRKCLWTYVLVQEAEINESFSSNKHKHSKESDLKYALIEETKSLVAKTEASMNSTIQQLRTEQTKLVQKVDKLIQVQEQNMQYMQNKYTRSEIGMWDGGRGGMGGMGGGPGGAGYGQPPGVGTGQKMYHPKVGEEDVNDQNAKDLLWAELRNKKKKRIRSRVVKKYGEHGEHGEPPAPKDGGDGSRSES
jgi:hypothetical protein